jgi:thiol:disulfide interchange protein DsbC
MKSRRTLCALVPAALLLSASVLGAEDVGETDLSRILETFPELSTGSITPSPIAGIYQIMLGGQISYVSADGRYLIQGDIYDTVEERNLTESHREAARQTAIDRIGESNMIVFRPEEVQHTITVFTDIDCGFCRKLHRQIAQYNERGIEVRYLFFPRSGPDTTSWFKAENVWCADDRNAALTRAKSGIDIKSDDCGPTPVAQHYELGRAIGIRGTPAIVAQGGELIPGYVSPNELLDILEE